MQYWDYPQGAHLLNSTNSLLSAANKKQLSFKNVSTFNLDEYIGVEANNRISYRQYMNTNIFDHIDIDIQKTHIPDGMANDPQQESKNYEKTIQDTGGIDLQILGIGSNGHIGFNEPTSSLASRTRVKTLTRSTIHDNSKLLVEGEFQPRLAITMGIATIMEAQQIALLATGESKANAVKATIEGPLSAMCPGSVLQMHPNTAVIIDDAAAHQLDLKEYYKDVYQESLLIKNS